MKDKLIKARHSTEWWEQLGKDNGGSRPRCVLLMGGEEEEVAKRLTQLVDVPDVLVRSVDTWMPRGKPFKLQGNKWNKSPAHEAELDKAATLLDSKTRDQLRTWWLAAGRNARTPNWDIASTCSIGGKQGLLLIEAKAHAAELAPRSDKCGSNNIDNLRRISEAISEANVGLHIATEGNWNLSSDHHYQLSNRFAWAWKLASLGVPVVLVYLGFLNAQDMAGRDLFRSGEAWEQSVKKYGEGVVDNSCWGQSLDIEGTPLLPLILACEQAFYP